MLAKFSVDRYGAFTVNRVGVRGLGFPLSFATSRADGIALTRGTALRARDLVTLIRSRLQPEVRIFNIGHHWIGADGRLLTPSEVASAQGVDVVVHNVGWASRNNDPRAELLVLPSSDMVALLDGWGMYDVAFFDASDSTGASDVEQLVLAVNTWSVGDPPLLSSVTGSGVGATLHDDCYFYLETRHEDLPGIVLGGLLATYVGAALIQEPDDVVEVGMPPSALVSELLRRSPTWTGELLSSAPREVVVGLSTTGWKLGEEVPPAELGVVYDPATSLWSY
jgi:hypothetical protein